MLKVYVRDVSVKSMDNFSHYALTSQRQSLSS